MSPRAALEADGVSAIDRLLAENACRQLILESASRADASDPDGLSLLYTEDGILVRPGAEALQGRAAIAAAYRARPADRMTRHLLTNVAVTLESSVSARGVSSVLLWSTSATEAPGPFGRPAHPRQVVGEFHDRFTLVDGQWKIARRDASFIMFVEGKT